MYNLCKRRLAFAMTVIIMLSTFTNSEITFAGVQGIAKVNVVSLYKEDSTQEETAGDNYAKGILKEGKDAEGVTTRELASDETTLDEITSEEQSTEEGTTEEGTTEEVSTEEPTTEEPTTEEPTTEEPTSDIQIIDGVYAVRDGILIKYLGDKSDKTVTKLSIPACVARVENKVFYEFKYIKSVSFQSGSCLKEIGEYAFSKCTALEKITLPKGLDKIGYRAFGGDTALTSFTIPSTVTAGNQIFGTTNSVTKVTFSKGIKKIPTKILKYAYSVEKITLSEGVTTIGNSAFYSCKALKTITLPSTVTTIEKYAFKNCASLPKLTLSSKVTSIGKGAFTGTKELTLLVYSNSTAKAFARKYNLKWDYTSSEKRRMEKNKLIYDEYLKKVPDKFKKKFKLKKLSDYVPQGTCVIGSYVIVSMYHNNLSKKSVLLVYKKSTGDYVKKLVLPSKDHVGSITNIEGKLVVGLNNISSTDYAAVIKYSKLKNAKNGATLKYDYKIKLAGCADFAGYDGKIYWAGKSANNNNCKMYGYKVKIEKKKIVLTQKYIYSVPANIQGLVVKRGKNSKRTFIFSQSYGRIKNSSVLTYNINITKDKSLKTLKSAMILPSMMEGIAMDSSGYIYMLFESAAKKYSGNPDNKSELQINNVCKLKYDSLNK